LNFIICGLSDVLKQKHRETKGDNNAFIYFVRGYKFLWKFSLFFQSPLGFTEISDQAGSSLTSVVEQTPLTQEVSSPQFLFRHQENLYKPLYSCILHTGQFAFTVSSFLSIAPQLYILQPVPEQHTLLII